MPVKCTSAQRNATQAGNSRNHSDLVDDLSSRRFASLVVPVGTSSPSPPPFPKTLPTVHPLPALKSLGPSKPAMIFSNVTTPSASDNGASVTGNILAGSDKTTTNTSKDDATHIAFSHTACGATTPVPQLVAPQARASAAAGPRAATPPLASTFSPTVANQDVEQRGRKSHLVFRVPSTDEETQLVTASGQDPSSPQNRRITFMIDGRSEANEMPSAPATPPPVSVRPRNVLAPTVGETLHSEMGMFQLEYLDEGGKLQRRLTAFYNYCANQMSPTEEDAEVMFADHLGPFLRESRQFREYVVDDIDRACGVTNTAVTLSANEEEPAHPAGSVTSDGNTDTTTVTGTVVNALKDLEAPASSEVRESYQPLQAAVFESALRKAWEWKQKNRAEASHAADATITTSASGSLPSASLRSRTAASPTPAAAPSPIVTEVSQTSVATAADVGSAAAEGAGHLTTISPTTTTTTMVSPTVTTPKGHGSSTNGFTNSCLPTFKAEVKAAMQLDNIHDPQASLSALQVTACELCTAELVGRKVLWTSFLAERYELLTAFKDMYMLYDSVDVTMPSAERSHAVFLTNSHIVDTYFYLTLEAHLPWMVDTYLAAYKPKPISKLELEQQQQQQRLEDSAAGSKSLSSVLPRKFRSVVHGAASNGDGDSHASRYPLPLPSQRHSNDNTAAKMPSIELFLKNNTNTSGVLLPATAVASTLVFTLSFLFKFSFIILDQLAVVPRMLLPHVVSDAMHVLMPSTASFARDSLLNSLTHSASLPIASDSITTAQGHDGNVSERPSSAADVTVNGGPSTATTPTSVTATGTATAHNATTAAALQTRLLRHFNQLARQPEVSPTTKLEVNGPTTTTRARKMSHYEKGRVWLKMLFRFFRDEAAYNFMNDSPISMRIFFALPDVSWERVMLRSFNIMAWDQFHGNVIAAAETHWGFKEKTRSSRRKGRAPWEQEKWDRALRHCEQEALNTIAAMHELWYMTREWWLLYIKNTVKAVIFTPTNRAGLNVINGAGMKRRSRTTISLSSPDVTPQPPPLPPLRTPASRLMCRLDPLLAANKFLVGADGSRATEPNTALKSGAVPQLAGLAQDQSNSCGSPPSVPSSLVAMPSLDGSPSRTASEPLIPALLPPRPGTTLYVRPALQKVDASEVPQLLQGSLSTPMNSSGFSTSLQSIMSSVSQPSPVRRQKLMMEGMRDLPPCGASNPVRLDSVFKKMTSDGARLPQVNGCLSPTTLNPTALLTIAYGGTAEDVDCNNSRLLVPPMTATINGFYKGRAADWDTVMLVRLQTLSRAVVVEQQGFERLLVANMRRSSASAIAVCAQMDECMKAEEDVWLAHRRNAAKYTWDQVCMEKHLFISRWSQEQSQLHFVTYAVLSLQSLAELELDAAARLVEDFQQLIREARAWVAAPPSKAQKLTSATMALGPSNSNSLTDEVALAARRALAMKESEEETRSRVSSETARGSGGRSFDFWGYGSSLPPAGSSVGFNDGLVVMSRLCRDMHLSGKRLRTHWFLDKDDDASSERTHNFHEISYANHDTYTGFTRVQAAPESDLDSQLELEMCDMQTPSGNTDSMTDIHRDGDDGAGSLLRHGLGNYSCKSLGYTYVGGWYQDRPHGDGALLYNGVLPWESRRETLKKSLLLIFGRWEHGRLVHIELTFSGVPLS